MQGPATGIPADFHELLEAIAVVNKNYQEDVWRVESRLKQIKYDRMQEMDEMLVEYQEGHNLDVEEMRWLLNAFGRPERV